MKKCFKSLLPCLILINAYQAPNFSNTINSGNNNGKIALINSEVPYTKKDTKVNSFEEIYGKYLGISNYIKKWR